MFFALLMLFLITLISGIGIMVSGNYLVGGILLFIAILTLIYMIVRYSKGASGNNSFDCVDCDDFDDCGDCGD